MMSLQGIRRPDRRRGKHYIGPVASSCMFGSRTNRETVTCIACGETVTRSDAREYDKYGNRWERHDKQFEYLCKACFTDVDQQSRDGLESVLNAAGAGETDQSTFLQQFRELSEDRRLERDDSE